MMRAPAQLKRYVLTLYLHLPGEFDALLTSDVFLIAAFFLPLALMTP